jgi:alpha-mannosidase
MKFIIRSLFMPFARPTRLLACALLGFLEPATTVAAAAADLVLWQIGKPDGNNAEFALAPAGYRKFQEGGFFVVGDSNSERDWPYVHPGRADAWAGGRDHIFTILFGLKSAPASGECTLEINLLDTHSSGPPKLNVQINGRSFRKDLPRGAGDASLEGEPSKGRPHNLSIPFPAELLRSGDNDLQITAIDGSWILYDSLALKVPIGVASQPVVNRTLMSRVQAPLALREENGRSTQPVLVALRHFSEPQEATVEVKGAAPVPIKLQRGNQTVEVSVPAVSEKSERTVMLKAGDRVMASSSVSVKPVSRLTVYILPHSHTDIGYTEPQADVEAKQVQNLVDAIAVAKRTANYPEGARFVWNVEVAWAANLYLERLNDSQRAELIEAVRTGRVVLNGMYLNTLTGLCRPEELFRLFSYSTKLARETGVPIESAMISDVPGYTWGTVTAMAQAGIKYFSTAPNNFDRIGNILQEWENKPFYWVGPDGHSKVLVWIPFWGYALSHRYHEMSQKLVDDLSVDLQERGYPYDIAYVRWAGHGDNALPDPAICEFVKEWNVKYSSPRFIISGATDAFQAFEKRYGDKLPVVAGDWTPYWEDGAGSSSYETGMNRNSSDRLAQAETLFAMSNPAQYPVADFADAWRHVLLYSEHTWGAWCSISGPERKETIEQWAVKKSYADTADRRSRELLSKALQGSAGPAASAKNSIDLINTLSWPRTELVTVSAELSSAGDRVTDEKGRALPSQRLASGELAFIAKNLPPFSTRGYQISQGTPAGESRVTAKATELDNGLVRLRVDPKTGGIVEFTAKGIKGNLADTSEGEGLNDYIYLIGDDLKYLQRNGPVKISIGEKGPLVASLIIESEAPGCKTLRRELRMVARMDYVELINLVDKERLKAQSYHAKEGKESVNFAFPFNVPEGEVVIDIPLAKMRPDIDQMPSSCKDWFTVGRWTDVANADYGVTWVTLDAPLVQVGGITARLLNSQTNPDVWRKKVGSTQKLYSWAMNNHWGTNYRAYQDGPTVFRFILRPHRGRNNAAEATRFATGFSQPMQVTRGGTQTSGKPLLQLDSSDVLVTGLKPTDDRKGWIIRLFAATAKDQKVKLQWGERIPKKVCLSDTTESPGEKVGSSVSVPGFGVVTLRAEF